MSQPQPPSVRYQRARLPGPRPSKSQLLTPQLYFIRDDASGWIKIGFGADPIARLYQLQSGNPGHLTLLATRACKKAPEVEAHLHAVFGQHRGRGEWFEPAPKLLLLIRVLRNEATNPEIAESVCRLTIDRTIYWALDVHGVSLERWQTVFERGESIQEPT